MPCFTFGAIKAMGPSYNWWGLQTNSLVENINSKRFFNSGIYNYLWEGENLSSGIYFITLQAEVNNIQPVVFSRKMIYLK